MITTRPYIVYTLSKNRTTQKFNDSRYNAILDEIDAFFKRWTNADINAPQTIKFIAFTAFDQSDPREQLELIIHNATQHWGVGNVSPVSFHYPSGEPSETLRYEWEVTTGRFREALGYLSRVPMPQSQLGPMQLFFSYSFKLLDPITKNELPNQQHFSNFCIWFSKTKSIAPTIFFPFENAGNEFWNYIDAISKALPFKLEEKYLRVAVPNKLGEAKSFKKIVR